MTIRQALRSLLASRTELDAGAEQVEALKQGAQPVAGCGLRQRVQLSGVIRSVTFPPGGSAPELTAELYDGSGSVDLVWLGRREIPGIEPGRRLTVTGTPCRPEPGRERPVLYNPAYRLLTSPRAPQ